MTETRTKNNGGGERARPATALERITEKHPQLNGHIVEIWDNGRNGDGKKFYASLDNALGIVVGQKEGSALEKLTKAYPKTANYVEGLMEIAEIGDQKAFGKRLELMLNFAEGLIGPKNGALGNILRVRETPVIEQGWGWGV